MAGKLARLVAAVSTVMIATVTAVTGGPAAAAGRPTDPGGPPLPAAATSQLGLPQKVLMYGDSITMGTAAHWTWRYRLWKGLQAAGTSVDFVGPVNTVRTFDASSPYSTEYRDPNFDTAHGAMAGMLLTQPVWTVSQLANQYRPDVIVGLIGFNDLVRGVTPTQLVSTWRDQIAGARKANPGVSVVLVQMGQTWYPGISDYDAGLAALAAEMDRPGARVVTAAAPVMDMWTDTQDFIHLTASGEQLYAHQVAAALAQLGLPSAPAPADPPDNGAFAPTPSAALSGSQVTISWPSVDYATSEDVYATDDTTGVSNELRFWPGTSLSAPLQPGHTYEVSLAPVQGWAEVGTRSKTITFTVPSG